MFTNILCRILLGICFPDLMHGSMNRDISRVCNDAKMKIQRMKIFFPKRSVYRRKEGGGYVSCRNDVMYVKNLVANLHCIST